MKIAIVGLGGVAEHFHIPLIKKVKEFEIVAVVTSQDKEMIFEKVGEVDIYSNVEGLLADQQLDLVIVLSPNHCHYQMVKEILNARVNVLVDKPFTVTSNQANELVRLAQKNNKLLTVYHNRRADGDFLTLHGLIKSGKLGVISYVESRFDKYKPVPNKSWKEQDLLGNGIVYDIGSHLIDQALVLFGLPESVDGRVFRNREHSNIDDTFWASLNYKTKQVVLRSSSLVKSSPFRFYVEGSKGTYQSAYTDVKASLLHSPQSKFREQAPIHIADLMTGTLELAHTNETILIEPGEHELFYDNILNAMKGICPPIVTGEQAANTIKIVENIYLSHQLNKTIFLT